MTTITIIINKMCNDMNSRLTKMAFLVKDQSFKTWVAHCKTKYPLL